MVTIFDIANWFLSKESMSLKKLQKMVYYAYSWFIVLENEDFENIKWKLFDEKPQAWVHGPSFVSLYEKYKNHSYKNIIQKKEKILLNDNILDVLEQVNTVYGKFNANQLESITHQEEPWQKQRWNLKPHETSNRELNDLDIYIYYSGQMV